MRNKRSLISSLVFLMIVTLIVTLIWVGNNVAESQDLKPIRVGFAPFQDMLSVNIGVDQGFYEEAGLDVEIVSLSYEVVTEALAAGEIDLGGICETTIVTAWDSFPEQRIVNIFFTFEGSAIIVRPDGGFKTYTEFLEELGDPTEAVAATVAQLEGKTVHSTKGTDMEMGVAAALLAGGMGLDDIEIIDMNPDDGLAAFLAGSGDAYLGGLPQRGRLVSEGNLVLITAQDLGPEAVIQCGFSSTEEYANEHMDELVRFAHGTFLTIQYIDQNKEEAFTQITDLLNSMTGAQMTVEDLDSLWNKIEFFPPTGADMYNLVINPSGSRYWKPRLEFVYNFYAAQGLVENEMDFDEAFVFDDVIAQYMELHEPEAWATIQAEMSQ